MKSWLFTTLHREFLQGRRRKVRFPEVEFDAGLAGLPPVEPAALERLDGEQAVRLLNRLDPLFRVPLVLFYLEDQPYEEIAEVLELPLGTVKSRLSRGMVQLRALFAQEQAASGRRGV